jgi:CRISPR-associated protein Csm3
MKKLTITITTRSNLFIGGTPQTFEIGGVDMYTVVDHDEKPYIPASSFKGALREIVRDKNSQEIKDLYTSYLERKQKDFESVIDARNASDKDKNKFKNEYQVISENVSAEYLFGIAGFNYTPKLIFSDFVLEPEKQDKLFCIDMKNKIEEMGKTLKSNPRTYKTARKDLTFSGSITLHKIDTIGTDAEKTVLDFLEQCLKEFKEGEYRLGNSKSRGYGWIHAEVEADK